MSTSLRRTTTNKDHVCLGHFLVMERIYHKRRGDGSRGETGRDVAKGLGCLHSAGVGIDLH